MQGQRQTSPHPLTVLLWVEALKAVGTQEDVGLPLQGLAKGVAALRNDVVKDAACREDVHCVGLKRNAGHERSGAEFLPHSQLGRKSTAATFSPLEGVLRESAGRS